MSYQFLSNPLVEQHLQLTTNYVLQTTSRDFGYALHRVHYDRCESPAEAIFLAWWIASCWFVDTRIDLVAQSVVEVAGRQYRLDFLVQCEDRLLLNLAAALNLSWQPIAIEVDGHAFHERTLDQVTYRNQRDRDLQQLGYTVFHFSYEELVVEPSRCVAEVISAAQDQIDRFTVAIAAAVNDRK